MMYPPVLDSDSDTSCALSCDPSAGPRACHGDRTHRDTRRCIRLCSTAIYPALYPVLYPVAGPVLSNTSCAVSCAVLWRDGMHRTCQSEYAGPTRSQGGHGLFAMRAGRLGGCVPLCSGLHRGPGDRVCREPRRGLHGFRNASALCRSNPPLRHRSTPDRSPALPDRMDRAAAWSAESPPQLDTSRKAQNRFCATRIGFGFDTSKKLRLYPA
jgi:hypothetical protein